MNDELKPCPFCGAAANLHQVARDWWRIVAHHDEDCIMDDCHAPTAPQTPEQCELLVAAWNRRAILAAGASDGQAEPVAWYIPDEDGRPFKTTGYSYDAAQWKYAGATVEPLYTHPSAEIAALRERIAGMEKDAEMPSNLLHVMRRIRRCENEVAAQVVLEHFVKSAIDAAIAKEKQSD